MPTIGRDAQIILDGTGYFLMPSSYSMTRMRIRRADLTRQIASGGFGVAERYVDQGPGKREWQLTVVADQTLRTYTGQTPALTGQQIRDTLHASYEKVNTVLSFTDPHNVTYAVHFDDLEEAITDIHSQAEGNIRYLLKAVLVEA